jgi:hypothetical protein
MLPQKSIHFLKRLLEMGPLTAIWLMYHRIKRQRFIRTWRNKREQAYNYSLAPHHHHILAQLRSDHAFDFLDQRSPAPHRDVYPRADQAVQQTFQILGHKPYTFSGTLAWHHDFTSTYTSPPLWHNAFYADIPIPSSSQTAQPDIKVPWEFSRLGHFYDLGYSLLHAHATHDAQRAQRYISTFVCHLEDWCTNNPFLYGVNWTNPMEVALRGINLVHALHFFKHEPMITAEFWTRYSALLEHHVYYLEHNWEVSDRPNNHYLADLIGHFYLCTCLRFIKKYERARRVTARKICTQLEHQILHDGTQYEGSTHYHRLVTELIELFVMLCDHSGIVVPGATRVKITRMQKFIDDCTDHKGNFVHIGDEDGGRVPIKLRRTKGLRQTGLVTYPHFGLSIIKDPVIHATFRHPTYHRHQPTGHFHHDSLSFTLSVQGIPIFVDPGTYCYTNNAPQRNYFRSYAAHNTFWTSTPNIDDPTNIFVLKRHAHPPAPIARVTDHAWSVHDYYQTDDMLLHRTVTYQPQKRFFSITDWPELRKQEIKNTVALKWALHVAPSITIEQCNTHTWLIKHAGLRIATLQTTLDFVQQSDVVSPRYGAKEPSTTLVATTHEKKKQLIIIRQDALN